MFFPIWDSHPCPERSNSSLINFGNKWASPSGKTCFITKIKGVDKVLGQFPVQSGALGANSMPEIEEGLKANDDFQFYAATKDVCPQQTEVWVKQALIIKICSHFEKVLSFCLFPWHSLISSGQKTLYSFLYDSCVLWLWALQWCIISTEGTVCSLMNEQSYSEGNLSSVIVDITEVTQPVASCQEGNVKKNNLAMAQCALYF